MIVRANIYGRVRKIHQARLLVLGGQARPIRRRAILVLLGGPMLRIGLLLGLRHALRVDGHALPDPVVIDVLGCIFYLVAVNDFGRPRLLIAC